MKLKLILAACLSLFMIFTTATAAEKPDDEQKSDLWLKARLVTAYTLNPHLNPFELDVDVKDGVVRLGGTVDSPVERDLAVEIAKGMEGVTKVDDGIAIEPEAAAGEGRTPEFFQKVEDATIAARVKSKLLWNRNTNGLDIHVSVSAGVVALTGEVASDVHRDLAVQLAMNTPGVVRVKEDIKVNQERKPSEVAQPLERLETGVSDAWITTKVRSMLLFSKEAAGADVRASTDNRIVTLEGVVISDEQKVTIVKLVSDVVGVKEVRSKIAVK